GLGQSSLSPSAA
nr:immunoglobulin light chain junction region [Homo sapiens]